MANDNSEKVDESANLIVENSGSPGSSNNESRTEKESIVDLPEGVGTMLLTEGTKAHQVRMQESMMNGESSNNLTRHSAVKKFDQIGTEEAAGIARVAYAPPQPKA